MAVLEGFASPARVAALSATLQEHYPDSFAALVPRDHLIVGDQRFAFPVALGPPFEIETLLCDPVLDAVLTPLLGSDWTVESLGVVITSSNADTMRIHRDGRWLFGEAGIDRILPPVALTLSIPLTDLDEVSGRTQFILGSQREPEPNVDDEAFVAVDMPTGSCGLWDFRIVHRAEANHSDGVRALLYATVCRPFFYDHQNFSRTNRKLVIDRATYEALDPAGRSRICRAEFSD